MGFDNAMWHFDEAVTNFFSQWNAVSTLLVTALLGIVTVSLFLRRDPDVHPILLARQAQGSPVRQEGESPVFRARSAPHSMPLNRGLEIRDPGTARWARGRDGDLRDIWRKVVAGAEPAAAPGSKPGASVTPATSETSGPVRGRILTVYGNTTEETSIESITRQINLIGQHLLDQGGNRVAIYLPNSVEYLAALFACSFYNMTAILLPFDQNTDAVLSMLRRAAADTVITSPGCFPFDAVVQSYPALRQLVWVVDNGSAHLDWNEVPQGMGGRVNVSTWQDVLADAPQTAGLELPPLDAQAPARDMTIFWEPAAAPAAAEETQDSKAAATASSASSLPEEMVRFTNANLVAAIAAQLFAVPTTQQLGPSDLFLPADSLSHSHTLVLTLAALYSNASVALNSAAPAAVDLAAATRGIAPTVLVASPAALLKTHTDALARLADRSPLPAAALLRWQSSALSSSGAMPSTLSLASRLLDAARPAIGTTPGHLRLVYTAERVGAGAGTPPLPSDVLADLRVLLGSRIIYALTAAKVAGAAAQSAFYDYRVVPGPCAPFGPPLSCTEYLVRDKGEHKVTDERLEGEIVIRGPSVAGNEAALGVIGVIRDDGTLAYA